MDKDNFIRESDKISTALKKVSGSFGKIVCVTDNNKKLLGVLTSGDIRRAILSGHGSNQPIKEIYNKKVSENQFIMNIEEKESKEIDLVIVLNFLKRNGRFIFIGSIFSLFSSALISLLIPKTWQGEFQIVLQKNNQDVKIELTDKVHCSLSESIILYDRPTSQWFNQDLKQSSLILLGNGDINIEGKELEKYGLNVKPWIFWPRRPFIVEKILDNNKILNYHERTTGSIFIGNFENQVQEKYRKIVKPNT